MSDEGEVFGEYLRSRKLKLTNERKVIFDEIFARHDHFTADQLVDDIGSKGKECSRATVYRTLELLVESGLIQVNDFGAGRRFFEHTYGHEHHDHMVCVECGRIIEFVNDDIERLQLAEAAKEGLTMISHRMELRVVCENPDTCPHRPDSNPGGNL